LAFKTTFSKSNNIDWFSILTSYFKEFQLNRRIKLLLEKEKYLFVAAYAIIETKVVIVFTSPSA
jgi:hypothetical protein